MDTCLQTAQRIAEKINLCADVLVFSPVFGCEDALLEEICLAVGGRILCLLSASPNAAYRKQLSGGNRFFLGAGLSEQENKDAYTAVRSRDHCVLFASLSVLQQDDFEVFLNETAFSAMLLLQAQNVSPILYDFDKRLRAVAELRSCLPYTLPICAFCATDQSAVLRDITSGLELKTPARIYPGVSVPQSKLFSFQTVLPFTAFENRVREDGIQRALVLCANRQLSEDAYRYFRFFGYKCALSHGGLPYRQRSDAVERFSRGETDFLFTTRFTQTAFCTSAFKTAFLGIPADVFSLYGTAHPMQDIFVFYTQDDTKEGIFRIEDDNEVRAAYTNTPAYNLKQERLFLHAGVLDNIKNGIAPYEHLSRKYEHIYFDNRENIK